MVSALVVRQDRVRLLVRVSRTEANEEDLGERVLAHPHENEQPFTRSLSGVVIPDGVDTVTIAARDSVLGFCGEVFVLEVP